MSHQEIRQREALEQVAEVKRILWAMAHALKNLRPAVVLVTSAAQGEGKSLLTAALAGAAAQSGKYRVAALDLNWYRPTLHRFFGVSQPHSSQDFLGAAIGDLVCPSGQPGLDLLTAPGDTAQHADLGSQALQIPEQLIAQARERYDLVVIDSAAVFPTNRMMMDPVMLSSIVDGVMMVILAAVTARQPVRGAQKVMEAAGANILGAIGNHRRSSANR
jgi:protein-tyrosine kinase